MDQAAYDRYVEGADERHWWHAARRQILVDLIERTLTLPRPARILDVGCGTGLEMALLARYGEVWGIDVEPRMIDACRRRGLHHAEVARADRLAFANDSFDLITCLDSIEHMEDDGAVMCELSRVGKSGSHVCLTVPAGPSLFGPFDRLAGHYRRYSRRSLAALLTSAGYSIVRLSHFNSVFYLPIAAVRLATRHRAVRMDEARTLDPPARPINALMRRVFASERLWLRFVDAPFGLSLIAIARNDRSARSE